MRTAWTMVVALGLILTACSAGETSETTTTTRLATSTTTSAGSSSSSAPTTSDQTSTTNASLPESPVTGLAVDDPALVDRRVLAVKIDNHPNAIPQSGINDADMVIELMVEGITRLLTIWHESDSDYLGPMRSGRPTDPTLLAAFNRPTFALSGAQAWVQGIIRSHDIPMIKELSPGTFRISGRSAPHNLYVDTFALRETADERGYPDEPPDRPLWEFGPMPQTAGPASTVDIPFSGTTVVWTWDEETGTWLRTAYGRAVNDRDQDGVEERIGVPVLVALYTEQYTASPSGSGKPVPASRTVGSGRAFVFADGKVVEGTWERESETEWFTLLDLDGETLEVPPGRVWVSLVPAGRGLTFE